MISESFFIAAFIAILTYYLWSKGRNKKNLPPGPRGIPFFGNLFQIGNKRHVTYSKWAKEFGDIFTINMSTSTVLMINDHKLVKEVFSDAAFTGRMHNPSFDMFTTNDVHGLVNTEGEHWEQLRRFTLRQLRDFGFGKNSMEANIIEEVKETISWMKSQNGKPITDLKSKLTLGVVNSLWTIISGKRYQHDDPILMAITHNTADAINEVAEKGGFLFFAPWIRHILPEYSGYNTVRKVMTELSVFFGQAVDEHKASYSDDFTKDFIDVFLKEIKETSDPSSAFHGEYGNRQLIGSLADLFFAGSDTTSTTTSWIILYLSTFPEVQKKLQAEIEAITGNSRDCSLADRPNMPYTEAVITESLRFSSIVPDGLNHRATMERTIRGYTVPKDTIVQANIYYIHHNPAIWGDPENFRPERFLSPDGKTFKKNEALIPFSVGRRQCLGESLARDTMFLFLTNIIQRFTVKFDPAVPPTDLEPSFGFLLHPKSFQIVLEDRLE